MAILLKTVTGVKHDGIGGLLDPLVNLLSKWLCRAKITHMGGVGGFKHTFKGLFTEFVNQLLKLDPNNPAHAVDLRYRQGIIPGHMPDATSIHLPENVAKILGDRTLADMKTLAPGTVYFDSASTAPSHAAEKRQKQVSPAYHAAARSLDAELGSKPGSPGPVESKLNTYNSGNVLGLVAGAYAELSSAAAGISFSTPTNPAPWCPRRPMRTTRRHTPSTTTPAPMATRGRPLEGTFCLWSSY